MSSFADTALSRPAAHAPRAVPRGKSRLRERHALPRERLLDRLPLLSRNRVALVVAPAGCGKTTLLAQLAAAAAVPAVYYAAERRDADPDRFLDGLARSFARETGRPAGTWASVDEAALALERDLASPALLLVDDFHALEGTPAEEAFERLLAYAPAELAIVIATRRRPGFNWSRLLVSDTLVEIGADDLRFRSWEVERLFRDVYREPLPPEDLADLARRTEGWAAGLKLFHLATRGQPTSQRRRVLASLGARWDLAREYLARNVLDGLDDELRSFLLETSVLTHLSGRLCDELLGREGTVRLLRELAYRQLFTRELGDGSYRYHETLRSQLETMLVEEVGEREARRRFRRAGELLEAEGVLPDALRAYCRAEDWDAVARLLGDDGERIAGGLPVWMDVLPSSLLHDDPWLLLAAARRQRAAGRLRDAIELYREAERRFGHSAAADASHRERMTLAMWLEPNAPATLEPLALLRAATVREPGAARRRAAALGTAEGKTVAGLAALLAGDCREAVPVLRAAREELDCRSPYAAAAELGTAVALLLAGDAGGSSEARGASERAELLALPWLARLARASLALDGDDGDVAAAPDAGEHEPWSAALAALFEALGKLRRGGSPSAELDAIASRFRKLGAGVLEAWARGALALALARGGEPEARHAALAAESTARLTGVNGAQALAYRALAELADDPASELAELARAIADECSLALGDDAPASDDASRLGEPASPFELRCLGRFSLLVDGRELDVAGLKPRARTLLQLLALHCGRPVHREVLMEALWPDADPDSSARNLHVLISSLRHALEPGIARDASSLILREGDAYRLGLRDGAAVDLLAFDAALANARAARAAGDADAALAAYARALELYAGELLPAAGPAEWVLRERDRCVSAACEAARASADLLLEREDPRAAAAACERGLAADRYDDALWRLLAAAHERAGDVAAAARARARYEQALLDLGVGTPRA